MTSPGAVDSAATRSSDDASGPWTVMRIIRWSGPWLQDRGVETGRLDAEHLLAHALGTTRLQLYLQYDRPLTPDELSAFRPLIRRRGAREPLQYIIGRQGFRELDLAVDRRVLIPRPETEELVQIVLDWAGDRAGLRAIDIGTGSGCIALSLLAEGPFERVVATDVSAGALEVARANADALVAGALVEASRLEFRTGPGFGPVRAGERFDVVVSNPPYVGAEEADGLEPEVREWEPAQALFADADGLSVLQSLVDGAAAAVASGGLFAVEVGLGQAETLRDRMEARSEFEGARVHRDLTGRPRFVSAHRTPYS